MTFSFDEMTATQTRSALKQIHSRSAEEIANHVSSFKRGKKVRPKTIKRLKKLVGKYS